MKKNNNKLITFLALGMIAAVGTYNALMINSASLISEAKNFKRLDEVYGVVKEGRTIATNVEWQKMSSTTEQNKIVNSQDSVKSEVSLTEESQLSGSLELKLVEVVNLEKWQNGVKPSEFNGSISTREGIIESFKATLPENVSIDIAFTEMTGSNFEYDLNGEVFSGNLYQVDQNAYMISLENGPLKGTKLHFTGKNQEDEASVKAYLAENHNMNVGDFGFEDLEAEVVTESSEETIAQIQPALFNFNSQI